MQIWEMAMCRDVAWRVCKDFDCIKLNNEKPFIFQAPEKQFIQNLKTEFPNSNKAIDNFFKAAKRS